MVEVGVLVAKIDMNTFPEPVATLMMINIPISTRTPANPPMT